MTSQVIARPLQGARRGLRRLDAVPPLLGLALGVALGAGAGAALVAGLPLPAAAVAFALLVALGAWLAASGEAVAIPFPEPEPEPQPEPDEPPAAAEAAPRPPRDPLDLVGLPPGRFQMGSPESEPGRGSNEGPVHAVTVSSFRCMRYPVTRRLYAQVMGEDPGRPEGEADDRPVNNVTWLDAIEFCNRLSLREGLEPCYQRQGTEVRWNRKADGYRLPTEAEWEYAARAGTTTRWSFGDDEAELGRFAWYSENSEGQPHEVGTREPNPWGLHDLHGNVLEWCWDIYGPYSSEEAADPTGPEEGSGRVLRGGSFGLRPGGLRSAVRDGDVPEGRGGDIGFRCVRGSGRRL